MVVNRQLQLDNVPIGFIHSFLSLLPGFPDTEVVHSDCSLPSTLPLRVSSRSISVVAMEASLEAARLAQDGNDAAVAAMAAARQRGKFVILQDTIVAAARAGDSKTVLAHLESQQVLDPPDLVKVVRAAAEHGMISVLDWLNRQYTVSTVWDHSVAVRAVSYGQLRVAHWLLKHKPFLLRDTRVTHAAVVSEQQTMLRWLLQHQCPWDKDGCLATARAQARMRRNRGRRFARTWMAVIGGAAPGESQFVQFLHTLPR